MSNGLSQAEIDALLRGEAPAQTEETPPPATGQASEAAPATEETGPPADGPVLPQGAEATEEDFSGHLSPQEIDAMGEIGNISMGTSATALSTMLNRRVDITTPRVNVMTMQQIAQKYTIPFVAVQVQYTRGIEGTNILFLKVDDVKIITDLLMGGDGTNIGAELNEMHLSAIGEVMNQMVGSSATSLSKMMDAMVDISPPLAYAVKSESDIAGAPFTDIRDPLVRTSFRMEVEGLIHSEIMQVMPVDFAKSLVAGLLGGAAVAATETNVPTPEEVVSQTQAARPAPAPAPAPTPASAAQPAPAPKPMVDVRPAQFGSFDAPGSESAGFDENMELLMDVPLTVSVELGKSKKFIKEILDFNVGSIIVLDKMAGDMVDVVVNGKLIAKAEVVVIDDNYGARITEILSPSKRFGQGQ